MNETPDVLPRWLRNTDVFVNDLKFDLNNGIALIRLVEQLQKRSCTGRIYLHDPTEIQCLMNTQMALEALEEDGIKLINIGSQDIVTGNLKLILGLMWSIIQRYQIARSTKVPPKKLIMAWLQAVIPVQLRINNFSSNQNSCLAYISYFTKELGPGYYATLAQVQNLIPDIRIHDFGSSWNDGFLLCRLVTAVSGRIAPFENDEMVFDDPTHWIWNVRQENQQLNLDLAFAKHAELDVEDLTVLIVGPSGRIPAHKIPITRQKTENGAIISFTPQSIGNYRVHILCEDIELPTSPIALEVLPAPSASEKPTATVMSEYFDTANIGNVTFTGLSDPCPIGSVVEVVINAQGGPARKDVSVLSVSPKGVINRCEIIHQDNYFTAVFKPEEVGTYKIQIEYDHEPIRGSPFICQVFDADRVSVYGLDVGLVNQELKFTVDASRAGVGTVKVSVFRNEQPIPCSVVEEGGRNRYKVQFTPQGPGKNYRINITFNGMEIKNSPFILDIAHASSVSVHGDQLKAAAVGRTARFYVQTSEAELKDVNVVITDANDSQRHARVLPIEGENGRFQVEWKPQNVGEHLIDVLVYNQSVNDPIVCNVGDPQKVSVTRIPNFINVEALNKELSFEGRVHCEVQELSKRRYLAKFVPSEAIPHKIEMKFNGFPVKGSPWLVPLRGTNVYSSSKSQITSSLPQSSGDLYMELVGLGLHRAQVGEISFFDITTSTGHLKPADVDILDDSGKLVETRVIPLRTALRCEYQIAKVGDYRLEIRINGRLIDSGPLTVAGYDVSKVRVHPVRTHGIGNPAQFVVIDVTFNGVKVDGCPIRVDINEKSIGKQVSAPVVHPHRFAGSTVGVAGGTSPRPPSSAYFSAGSPQVDTSPTSPAYQQRESPRSPSLVAAHTREKSSDEEQTRSALRSPRLVHGANLGYTVAHYGEGTDYQKSSPTHPSSDAPRRYFGDPADLRDTASHTRTDYRAGESTVDSGLGSYSATSPRPHRYFESDTRSSSREPEWRRSVHESNVPPSHAPPAPPQEDTQFEMTRSAEVRLYRDDEGNAHPTAVKTQALTSHSGPTTGGVSESGYDYRVTSDSSAIRPSRDQHRRIEQSSQFSPAPIGDVEPQPDYAEPPIEFSSLHRTNEFTSVPLDNAIDQRPIEEQISKHKRQSSGAGSMTPGTRRKLMEHSVQRSADLKESSYEYQSESDTGASRSSKPTTPRLSLKFGSRDRGNRSTDRGFDFGKSKFSSKHEVVRLGKDVEVKLESLKLGKEDQLRVVVTPPSRGRATDESAVLSVPDLPHRLKKSGKTYEIIPTGTRKKEKAREKERKREAKKDRNGLPSKPVVSKIPSLSRVGKPATVQIQLPNSTDVVQATIVDSAKQNCSAKIFEEDANTRRIEFVPTAVGDHEIVLHVNDSEVSGSPFTCRAYDPSSIVVGQIPDGVVNKPVHFTVSASEAGVGNLEVSVNDGKIPSMAHALGQHKYDISFVPREPIDHYVSIRFNNEPVNGSPFLCRLLGTQQMRVRALGPGLDRVAVGRNVNFVIHVDDTRGGNASLPNVAISDPKGTPVPVTVYKDETENDSNSARFIAEYTPKSVGNHQVEVTYEGQPISGSPFSVKAFDASCVRLSLDEAAVVGQPCTFTVSAADAGAGSLELIVSVQDRNVPNFVEAEGQAKFKVSFTPQEARDHVISVKFNNEQVPGSPMVCPVRSSEQQIPPLPTSPPPADNDELRLVGDLAVAQVGRPKGFSIDSPHPNVDCNVIVTGDHQIDIQVNGRSLAICPIVCHVLPDSSTVPETVRCGEPIDFDLLLGRVAPNEEIRVEVRSGDGKSFPCSFDVDKKKGRVRVGCTVSKQGRYSVILYRNGSIAEEHFFVAESSDSVGVVFLSFPERALIDRSSRFELELSEGLEDKLMIDVTDPEGSSVPVSLHRTAGRTFAVDWTPKTAGTHTVDIRLTGDAKSEPPRQIRVLDLSAVQLVGLVNAPVGVQQRFNLEWGQSGGGNATVKVTHGDNKSVACQMRRLKHGVDACSFVPSVPGLYLIDVAIDGVTLPECPYECMIRDSGSVRAVGDALNSAQCGRTARFEVIVGNRNHDDLDVTISDPHRSPLPVRCYRQQDNTYWVEFTPEMVGAHVIEVALTDRSNHADAPIAGSPFHCEVVDPRRVAIRGLDDRLILRHIANVTINRRNAGNGQLDFEITDPSGVPLKVDRLKNSVDDDSFTFLPNRLGPHSIRVQLAGFPVPGLPKTIDVEEPGRITLQGPALESPVKVGEKAALLLDTRKAGGLKIDVRNPHGEKLHHSTNKRPDNTTEITFHSNDVGTHLVSVDFNNKKLVGSPYSVEVVDPRKVLVDDENTRDDGALLLATGERNAVDIDATAAGSGQLLRAEVRDPRGELLKEDEARIESPGRGKFRLLITPKRTGTHKIYLTFADYPVPSAHPLIAHVEQGRVSSPHGRVSTPKETRQEVRHTYTSSHSHSTSFDSQNTEHHARVKAYGDGINRAIVKEPTEFFIDATHAAPNMTTRKTPPNPLKVEATLIGDKADVPVRLVSAGPYLYKGTYTAMISGSYDLHVLVDDKPIRDSPFHVNVQAFKTPAESIEVDSRTLKIGILGEDVKTVINTKNATPGNLSAQCEGPSRLEYCELYDNRDGSPFVFSVCNPPDASKVRVYGPGIEHGILAKFESNFVVETRGAGAGQLTVRVRGPKGAFNVEMQRDRQQDRTIHCKYEPREPGDYQVEVKWHNEHVPGSPFLVLIVDTEEELQRFLSGGIPSPPPLVPFAPPGWVPQMPIPGVAPPLMGPPLAPSIYGPIPVGMMPPAHAKGRRSAPPQVVYGRAPRRH
ncbi:BMA-FLN-2, isoform d [Aphelenchoides besseyi]|nr:BMA-FLN-2, isoform d [Aphelenchoides besseyi]